MDALAELEAMYEAALARETGRAGLVRELDPRLHEYQRRAVQHLWDNPRAALFMQMGTGKTATVLQALTPEHFPVLVVAPKRVAEHVWNAERDIWRPDLSIAIAAGSPLKRRTALEYPTDVTVIGRDNLKDVQPGQFRTVVLDELSSFKNRSSQRWKAARKICDAAAYVWGLTGTPAPNGLMDLWAQVFLLDSGARLGRTLTSYRQVYFHPGRRLPNGVVIEYKPRADAQERIEQKLADLAISMKSADYLQLPPVTVNRVQVYLPTKVTRAYDQMVRTLVADLRSDGGQVHAAANAAVLTGKLSQITAGFLYHDGDTNQYEDLHDEKTAAVTEIVEGTGSPVLIFYRYRAELERLQAALPQARTIDERGVLEDWNAGRVPVLLAHPASAGHGLNLQAGGHTIIWSTLPWSLEEWDQSNARLARQGQDHPVIIHRLEVANTVDEAIYARLSGKADTQAAIMAALRLDK